nr:piggyBac transposable element-derived protein 3-like [Labrus bergylta]
MSARFYAKRRETVVMPAHPTISDDDEEEDDNVADLAVPRGTCDYVTSDDGILAVRWKDNKAVTLLSTDMGVEPMSSVIRYCSETKKKEPVSCPAVIRSYNANMGGIDKSDMLVHLYRTPMKSKRWYLRLFAYVIDVSILPGLCTGGTVRPLE